MPFHAHEVLEDAWKAAAEPERALWRGLAQLAVGLTHAARGKPTGAAALLRRGAENIGPYGDAAPHGIDVTGLARWANSLAKALDTHLVDATVPRLRATRRHPPRA
jgi:predicted metal-dependent hydrolase